MFKNRVFYILAIVFAAIFLSGCGEDEKLLKSRDYQKKYETGVV